MVLKPDGGEIYVNSFDTDTVQILNTNTNEPNGSFQVGRNPIYGVITHDMQRLYVANYGSDNIAILDPFNRQVLDSILVGNQPEKIYLTPDDLYLFVLNTRSNDIWVFFIPRTAASLFAIINVGTQPSDLVIK
jgi:YVTN family beta-propeller protein